MKQLIRKYRESKLSTEDVSELRARMESTTDEQLSKEIFDDWQSFNPSEDKPDDYGAEEEVWENINSAIGDISHNRRGSILRNFLRVASVILIIMLGSVAIHYYGSFRKLEEQKVCMTTGENERVGITLPDGSLVALGNESQISYSIGDFNHNDRRIIFSGVGCFDIRKDSQHPFVIESEKLDVTVKGTKFNLEVRDNANDGCIYLIEGNVELLSKVGNQRVSLHADEKAIVDFSTGNISVSTLEENDNPVAWQTGRLIFNKATFAEVASSMKKYYGDKFKIESNSQERFTGVIPLDNLDVANDIIRTAFSE